ncbi:CLUMA_CG000979, isoform A [Clunio marinus]|uniref:CLUMA_CG000979, isoform A n=1 Tax=Clunio marinus TaxID=568069 RepID=A0A1J1HH13_9DIPT|nr:CLUMA_CG000979, isoform A [Clunio marinus]
MNSRDDFIRSFRREKEKEHVGKEKEMERERANIENPWGRRVIESISYHPSYSKHRKKNPDSEKREENRRERDKRKTKLEAEENKKKRKAWQKQMCFQCSCQLKAKNENLAKRIEMYLREIDFRRISTLLNISIRL